MDDLDFSQMTVSSSSLDPEEVYEEDADHAAVEAPDE